ncbi:hypothetical protein P9F22_02790 [Bacillus amyloliquefaciens]|uniref:hypothetical protein n=1 Tax=Bacillus amyloliquefaciens TaxID=1390 RepID=UPI0015736023|nr:hypothetical protein [Bacillus amyloliquefaciens]MEC2021590.1 hypothetical protein [Bacillus amyloliquefaciens]MEC2050835.1 hypothetical protein [Bacillus amyloliquefaciens]QKN91800.1 hypothetical protein HTY60_07685 [Bacillus amyloliquefaciens]
MSLPNIPNITPDITLSRCETLNLLLSSVALEEIGLSHILQAEAERIQTFLGASGDPSLGELSAINRSTERLLRTVMKSQLLLQTKLEDIIYLQDSEACMDPSDPSHPSDPGDPDDPDDPWDPDDPCEPDDPCDDSSGPCGPCFPNPSPEDPCDGLFYGRIGCCECEDCEECGWKRKGGERS